MVGRTRPAAERRLHAFADFAIDGRSSVLGADLFVAGDVRPESTTSRASPGDPQGHAPGDPRRTPESFAATFPTAGRYRLFLEYKAAGEVRMMSFTIEVPA